MIRIENSFQACCGWTIFVSSEMESLFWNFFWACIRRRFLTIQSTAKVSAFCPKRLDYIPAFVLTPTNSPRPDAAAAWGWFDFIFWRKYHMAKCGQHLIESELDHTDQMENTSFKKYTWPQSKWYTTSDTFFPVEQLYICFIWLFWLKKLLSLTSKFWSKINHTML